MADLERWIAEARNEGFSAQSAAAKVCQDIILKAIAASDFSKHITIKGGVVMRSILCRAESRPFLFLRSWQQQPD